MIWGNFAGISLDPLDSVEGRVTANQCKILRINYIYPNGSGVFQDDPVSQYLLEE